MILSAKFFLRQAANTAKVFQWQIYLDNSTIETLSKKMKMIV